MMACALDTAINSICVDWMTPLRGTARFTIRHVQNRVSNTFAVGEKTTQGTTALTEAS
jgi:hypothetical protein